MGMEDMYNRGTEESRGRRGRMSGERGVRWSGGAYRKGDLGW